MDMKTMEDAIPPGTRRQVNGQTRVYYEGYWIKTYTVPENTLAHKKVLIEALTRRLFNHTEHGLNIPGNRLAEARAAYENEQDPSKKRVKGAMYAGAMFNRATDIFRNLVALQERGVEILPSNDLMRECGRCLQEAYALSRMVLHRSGEESIDELWGEPFRAFTIPLEEFYESRYIKIGQTKRDLDRIADAMVNTFAPRREFSEVGPLIREFALAAKIKVETLRTDPDMIDVWADFVTASERLASFQPQLGARPTLLARARAEEGRKLIWKGRDLMFYITRARVPMPKSTQEYIELCATFAATGATCEEQKAPLPA